LARHPRRGWRICLECILNPALSWGWAASSDNDDPFAIIGIAGTLRNGINEVAKLCRVTQKQVLVVYEPKIVDQMKERG
jgi:hypothetical protein